MPAFSVISQDPTIRALVQDGMLERAFHDALFPALLFRADCEAILYAGNVGDSRIFTGKGLLTPKTNPLVPGVDLTPSTVQYEQWIATMLKYGDSMDTYMPNSVVDIANLFLENAATLGLGAGQSMNRVVRDYMYNAALSGSTVSDVGATASASLHVVKLNGFTLARRPDLPAGSAVQFAQVSVNNPLAIQTFDVNGVATNANVIGYTSDNQAGPGDVIGSGTLLLDRVVTVPVRGAVVALNATNIVRVAGGKSIDAITSSSLFLLSNIRAAVARFRGMNVRPQASGYYHCHLDPQSEGQIFNDAEFNRLLTSLPDSFVYQEFAIGRLLGTVFLRNSEAPSGPNGTVATNEPIATELYTGGSPTAVGGGVPVHYPLFSGIGSIKEYYLNMSDLITEAGVTGKVGEPKVSADGIEVNTDRIQLIIRAPLDRLQELVSTSWKFYGAYAVRTDVTTGDAAAFKRFVAVEHGE